METYNNSLELNPEDEVTWTSKGIIYTYLEQYNKALNAYDKALNINPKYANAWYNKSCVYSLMNETGKALLYLEFAIGYNSYYKEKAKKDMDFVNLRVNKDFKLLVK